MSGLNEFKHLTYKQIGLFIKSINAERERKAIEMKVQDRIRRQQGGTIRVQQ